MNTIEKLFNKKAIILNLKSSTKNEALKEISKHLKTNGFIDNEKKFYQSLLKREKEFSTGLGEGIAIPHAQDESVKQDVVLVAKSKEGIEWGSTDKSLVHVVFSIALNSKNISTQTEVLADLAQIMMNKSQVSKIKKSKSVDSIMKLLKIEQKKEVKIVKGSKKFIAITACPTGIAHTFMAAQKLEEAAQELGLNFKVEKQGRQIENKLSQSDIDNADGIVLAIDKGIEGMNRFAGKTVIKTGTKKAISSAKELIKDSLAGKGEMIKKSNSSNDEMGELSWGQFKNVYKNLMGGVSRMLPFVIAGGILIGFAFLLDSGITGGNLGVTHDISRWFAGLGKTVFGIFVPILGAYVAYSIVGQEGLLPGFVAGLIASGGGLLYGGDAKGWSDLWGGLTPGIDQGVLSAGSGFIGAMIGGYIAAAIVMILRSYLFKKVSRHFQGIVSIIGMPVLSTLAIGVSMFVLQIPLAYFAFGLKTGLKSLQEYNLLPLLGIIIGVMMASDMGGPINKSAYVFATGLLSNADQDAYQIMGITMIAGMVPPIAIAFSTLFFRNQAWNKKDQEAGYANWLMGAFFITEGAIPFAAQDPKRVLPSIIVGSAVAGGLMGLLKVGVSAPHGGIFVFALIKSYLFDSQSLQIGMGVTFALSSLIAGMVVGGLMLGFWRKRDIKKGKLVLV